MSSRAFALAASFFAASLLGACGGGGGGDSGPSGTPSAPAVSPVAGAWQGTSAQGNALEAIVLDDGAAWLVELTPGSLQPVAQMRATLQASDGQLAANDVVYMDFAAQSGFRGALQGSYVQNRSITAALQLAGASSAGPSTLAPVPTATYDYSRPASLNDVVGNWLAVNGAQATVSATGSFVAVNGGCRVTGTVSPHSSGKNVFNLALAIGAAPCSTPGQSLTGVAVVWGTGANAQLLVTAQKDAGNNVYSMTNTFAKHQ